MEYADFSMELTFLRPGPPVLTRLRLLMTSVLSEIGRGRPCSFKNKPQALQSTAPDSSRRHSGVVLVVQFWQTGCWCVSHVQDSSGSDDDDAVLMAIDYAIRISKDYSAGSSIAAVQQHNNRKKTYRRVALSASSCGRGGRVGHAEAIGGFAGRRVSGETKMRGANAKPLR